MLPSSERHDEHDLDAWREQVEEALNLGGKDQSLYGRSGGAYADFLEFTRQGRVTSTPLDSRRSRAQLSLFSTRWLDGEVKVASTTISITTTPATIASLGLLTARSSSPARFPLSA